MHMPTTESTNDWFQCQFFFYICTYALLVKALSCLPVFFWGDFDRDQPVTLKEYAHTIVKGLADLVIYVGMMAISLWIYSRSPGDGLLVLSSLFFAFCLFLNISQTSDTLRRRNSASELLRDTGAIPLLKAAVETVMFCPMLCVLLCGVHLRVLAMNNYMSQPQTWLQSCMYLCTVAFVVQLGMVLVTGMIAGEPAEVMPKSLYSTFTAAEQTLTTSSTWTLTTIVGQYISLACLFLGTTALICGIFFVTPTVAA
jgi:hypothetical protein